MIAVFVNTYYSPAQGLVIRNKRVSQAQLLAFLAGQLRPWLQLWLQGGQVFAICCLLSVSQDGRLLVSVLL